MTNIGFKTEEMKRQERLPVLHQKKQETVDIEIEQLLKLKGMALAHELLSEFFNDYVFPLYNGEERILFFGQKLMKIKERYFDKI